MDQRFNTKDRMNFFGIKPTKSLGQNFLNDISVVQEIVYSANVTKEDIVIEVGPGLGVMTDLLADAAGLVIAVEIDKNLIPPLMAVCEMHDNIELINADILKLNVHEVIAQKLSESQDNEAGKVKCSLDFGEIDNYNKESVVYTAKTPKGLKNVKIVANLPYYITTPIIFNFLENKISGLKSMTFMVQKEVAKRMTAASGGKEYGALTVTVGYFSEAEINFIVPPHCFIPQPNVDSAVITLTLRDKPPFELVDQDYFFKVIKAAFCQRRKMLANSLGNAPYLGVTREQAAICIERLGKSSGIRGEVLSSAEFGQLSNLLYEIKS